MRKPSTAPAMMPGSASGSVTVANRHTPLAPNVAAASSSRRSIASIDSRIAPHHQRKRHHAAGQRRAGPAEREHDADCSQPRAENPAPAERDQQQIAGHDRRQHQRQIDQCIEQRLAAEILARQQPGHRDAERQRNRGRHARTRSDSATAVHCSGDNSSIGRHDTGVIRKLKPYFSKIALARCVRRNCR